MTEAEKTLRIRTRSMMDRPDYSYARKEYGFVDTHGKKVRIVIEGEAGAFWTMMRDFDTDDMIACGQARNMTDATNIGVEFVISYQLKKEVENG